jgi:NaMN:DMB phosphoribosyltransferase
MIHAARVGPLRRPRHVLAGRRRLRRSADAGSRQGRHRHRRVHGLGAAAAREIYGVVLDGGAVDAAATAARREEIRALRRVGAALFTGEDS